MKLLFHFLKQKDKNLEKSNPDPDKGNRKILSFNRNDTVIILYISNSVLSLTFSNNQLFFQIGQKRLNETP